MIQIIRLVKQYGHARLQESVEGALDRMLGCCRDPPSCGR